LLPVGNLNQYRSSVLSKLATLSLFLCANHATAVKMQKAFTLSEWFG